MEGLRLVGVFLYPYWNYSQHYLSLRIFRLMIKYIAYMFATVSVALCLSIYLAEDLAGIKIAVCALVICTFINIAYLYFLHISSWSKPEKMISQSEVNKIVGMGKARLKAKIRKNSE
jgi:hypothetical protein